MKKSVLIALHLSFWLFIGISLFLASEVVWALTAGLFNGNVGAKPHFLFAALIALSFVVIGACVFYAAYFSLHFFIKRPIRLLWILAAYVIYTVAICIPGDWAAHQQPVVKEPESYSLFLSIVMTVAPILYFNICGFLFRIFVEWIGDRKLKVELEKDKVASQLELLKSKIDPHFLFNNLNNIDVFIQEDPKRASDYLKKLSDILRFMLYEAGTGKVPLLNEIDYISKYIDLQKIRTSNPNFVKLDIHGNAINKQIAPMILIHFIENAFKHAGNKKINDAVEVRFDVSEKALSFFCKNHISATKDISTENKGMGIQLLRQKLDLLYKKNYTLVTKEENNWYLVTLSLPLNEN